MEARALVDQLVDDAEFVNIFGMRMRGRAGIKAGHAHAFAVLLAGTTLRTVHVDLKPVGNDVAVLHQEWKRERDPDAAPSSLPPGSGILTLVAHRSGGDWKLVAATNVAIAAQPGGPPPPR